MAFAYTRVYVIDADDSDELETRLEWAIKDCESYNYRVVDIQVTTMSNHLIATLRAELPEEDAMTENDEGPVTRLDPEQVQQLVDDLRARMDVLEAKVKEMPGYVRTLREMQADEGE